jgi:hypothetical protein
MVAVEEGRKVAGYQEKIAFVGRKLWELLVFVQGQGQ